MLEMMLKSMLPEDFDINAMIAKLQGLLIIAEQRLQQIDNIEKKLDSLMNLKTEAQNEIARNGNTSSESRIIDSGINTPNDYCDATGNGNGH